MLMQVLLGGFFLLLPGRIGLKKRD